MRHLFLVFLVLALLIGACAPTVSGHDDYRRVDAEETVITFTATSEQEEEVVNLPTNLRGCVTVRTNINLSGGEESRNIVARLLPRDYTVVLSGSQVAGVQLNGKILGYWSSLSDFDGLILGHHRQAGSQEIPGFSVNVEGGEFRFSLTAVSRAAEISSVNFCRR